MEETQIAPLTRQKLEEMAVKFYGNTPTSGTIRNAIEFGQAVLREADRLLEPWKKRKLCEIKGHQFVLQGEDNHAVVLQEGIHEQVLASWKVPAAQCRNCDMQLVLVEGIAL